MPRSAAYFDYAASTPADPQVVQAMLPYFTDSFGNPSSVHGWGQRAEQAVEQARQVVADDLGCRSDEIIFTSGGTESDSLALRGVAYAAREQSGADHLLISPVEHDAVLNTARSLSGEGFELELLPVDATGRVDPDELAARLRTNTAVVSIIFGNNEIGTLNPIEALATICREHGVPLHTDALQVTSQLEHRVERLQVDLLSIGAHKFYGPKGVGALYVRQGTPLHPIQWGGSQERGRRAGTSNVPLIVGLAEALKLAGERRQSDAGMFSTRRDRIIAGVTERIPQAQLTGHRAQRLPNHSSFVFAGVDGNQLLAALDLAGFACSSGSACKTGDPEPSEVLLALGMQPELSLSSLRVTVGRHTTSDQVESLLETLPKLVARLRQSELISQ